MVCRRKGEHVVFQTSCSLARTQNSHVRKFKGGQRSPPSQETVIGHSSMLL